MLKIRIAKKWKKEIWESVSVNNCLLRFKVIKTLIDMLLIYYTDFPCAGVNFKDLKT